MKTYTSFSLGDMIMEGWELFKQHLEFIVTAGVITVIITGFFSLIQSPQFGLAKLGWILWILVGVVIAVIRFAILLGWSKVLLQIIRENTTNWKVFKFPLSLLMLCIKAYLWLILYVLCSLIIAMAPFVFLALMGHWIGGYALVAVGLTLAMVSIIVVGCYFRIRYQFLAFVVLDNPELQPHELFKKAGKMTKGNIFQLLGFGAVLGIINLVGSIPFGLGLILSYPTTRLARTRVYQYLKDHQN